MFCRFLALSMLAATSVLALAHQGPAHWVEKREGLPEEAFTAIAVDPFDDQVVYVGLDGFLFRSDDGGESWGAVLSFARGLVEDGLSDSVASTLDNTSAEPPAARRTYSIDDGKDDDAGANSIDNDVDPDADDVNNDELNADDNISDDGDASADDLPQGSSRAQLDDIPDLADLSIPNRVYAGVRTIAFVPQQQGAYYVATPRGLYRSFDSAKTFTKVALPGAAAENDIRDVVINPDVPSHIVVATAAGVWSSVDAGVTLTRFTGVAATLPTVCMAIDTVGDQTWIVLGTEQGLLRSRDNGANFSELLLHGAGVAPVIHAVAWARDGSTLYAGTGGGLFAAERNASILERHNGVPHDAPTSISIDPGEQGGIAVSLARRSNSVVFSDDTGLTLVEVDRLPAPSANALAREHNDSQRLWAASDRGVFRLEKGTGISINKDGFADLRQRFSREPSLEKIIELARAHRTLGNDNDRFARARWAPILPRLQLRFDMVERKGEATRDNFVFDDGTTIDDGTQINDGFLLVTPSDGTAWLFTGLMTWDLDRLILNPDEAALFRAQPVVQGGEHSLIDRVRELYVTRRRLIADREFGTDKARGTKALIDNVHRELKLQEIEAALASIVGSDVFDPSTSVNEQQE